MENTKAQKGLEPLSVVGSPLFVGDTSTETVILDVGDSAPSPSPTVATLPHQAPGCTSMDTIESLSELTPSVTTLLDSTLFTSYRDILLAHLPIYSDKASLKDEVQPLGPVHCQNVTIHQNYGRWRLQNKDSGTGIEHIPLYTLLSTDSTLLDSRALRASPLTMGDQ